MEGIVTEYSQVCVFCGRPREAYHHLLMGNGMRQLAEEDGIKIPVCHNCHNAGKVLERIHDNPMGEAMSKIAGQLAWEKHVVAGGVSEGTARELFRVRFGRSYL